MNSRTPALGDGPGGLSGGPIAESDEAAAGPSNLSFTKCDLRHTGKGPSCGIQGADLLRVPVARGNMTDQIDDLNSLPGGRGFTALILAAVAIVAAFMIIQYYSP